MVHSTIFDTQMSVLYRGCSPCRELPPTVKKYFSKNFYFIVFSPCKQKHNLPIILSVAPKCAHCSLTTEYQVPALEEMLDGVEDAICSFPEGFLDETLEAGQLHIYLARSLEDGDLTAQFWQNGDCHIVIANQGCADEGFYQGVAYAIDSHVLGNSRKFDDWNKLNPEGFLYSYSYSKRPDAETYLRARREEFASDIRFAMWQGFQWAMDCHRDPVYKLMAQLDFEELCQESQMHTLPAAQAAQTAQRAFTQSLPEDKHALLDPIIDHFAYLETYGYKLAHAAGVELVFNLLRLVTPGHIGDSKSGF